jgi:hypothetical protein
VSRLERLIDRYRTHINLPWQKNLSGVQRSILVVYDKADERRIRARIGEFEIATKEAGHGWILVDLTRGFGEWMGSHKYRESYFARPVSLPNALPDFEKYLQDLIRDALQKADDNTVVAVMGVGSLFGLTRVSTIIGGVGRDVPGRLLVLFPGEFENNTYRLLDARDGWNYLAVPITAHQDLS